MTAEEQTAIPWNGLPPSRQLPVTRKSWNRRSSGAGARQRRAPPAVAAGALIFGYLALRWWRKR